jgi:hypothetical protein
VIAFDLAIVLEYRVLNNVERLEHRFRLDKPSQVKSSLHAVSQCRPAP